MRAVVILLLVLLATCVWAQQTLIFEAEECSTPRDAWGENIKPDGKWNLWSTDTDANKKWSGGVVLQSAVVERDREKPEDGAPVLHTVITGIPEGFWDVSIKYGRGLAISLDGKVWRRLSDSGGRVGQFEITDGRFEFWVDDRYADLANPGSCYYDCVYLTPTMPAKMGVANGDFEVGDDMPGSGWKWFSRDNLPGPQFSDGAKSGKRCVLISYDGERDWAFSNQGLLDVKPGQVWTASAWMKCHETEGAELAIVGLSKGQTMNWSLGADGLYGTRDWTRVEATAFIPEGCDQIYVRLVGGGKSRVWVDDVSIREGKASPKAPPKPKVKGWAKERVNERLGRGVVALPVEGGRVYVSWRLLRTDPGNVAFNVYRATGRGRPVKLNAVPIAATTDFVDEAPTFRMESHYWVRPVVHGKELEASDAFVLPPNPEVKPYLSIKLQGEYTAQKVGIGDLNGDGRYDFVIKQPSDNIDPYHAYWTRSPDTYKIEAYLSDGTFLWRKDLGWAIERGIWYSPYLVYDLDGDGKAEVAAKTGEGDPRDPDGRVTGGPEYLSLWDGMTGEEKARVPWPSREGFSGANGYNYASRNQLGVAFLDGKTPCLLVARGTYTTMKLEAYQYHAGKLEKLWSWDGRDERPPYRGQGAHFMHCGDVDGDGKDEVVLGSCVIDDNGDGLWSTGLGHPDHCYLGDIDPSRPGLEIYYGIEPGHLANSVCLVDAKTGEILWGINERTWHVHGSGLCSDFDPLHLGMECYSGESEMPKEKPRRWLHSAKGELLADERTWDVGLSPRAVYWDADPQRELVLGGRVLDYLGKTHTDQVQGSQIAWADVLGDWREEIITTVPGELRIYTTTIPATDRRACLMQDSIYRADVAHLAMGYPQPPMTSYCLGGASAALGIWLPPERLRVGQTIEAKVLVAAPADGDLSGTVRLDGGTTLTVEPTALRISAPSGGVGQATFKLTLRQRPAFLSDMRDALLTASFEGGQSTVIASQYLKVALSSTATVGLCDEPLQGVPLTQAEDFAAQGGGEVQIRDDKTGALGKAFSHWDAKGHWLTWKIAAPEGGDYLLVVRYCCPKDARREVVVDDRQPVTQVFRSSGGFSAGVDDWRHEALRGPDGKPLVLKLAAGEHTVKLTNVDGVGLNLDYLALMKAGAQ